MDNNYVFDWDSEISNEDAFVILPEGDYEFTVTNFERGNFEGSEKMPACKKAIVTFAIEGEKDTASLTENFLLCAKMEWKLSALFLSVSMKKHGEPLRMDWKGLVGRKGRCHVKIEPYNGKDYNKITKFYAYDEDVEIIQPAAPGGYQQSTKSWTAGNF